VEPQYRRGKRRIRPFARSAGVSARGCSRQLQRAATDFGADVSYAQAMDKLVEHYGVVVAESTIRRITQHHGRCMHERSGGSPLGLPEKVVGQQTFIVEADGSMVPTVCPGPDTADAQADRRKGKRTQWQEVKLSLAHAHGSQQLFFGATLDGDVATAGKQLRACAKRAGFAANHCVHALGDGAPWIAQQVKQRFGSQGSYLVDFYHVCDYLAAAAKAIEDQPCAQRHWLDEQKRRLKAEDGLDAVLRTLQCHLEPADTADDDAPVRQCWRYLNNRLDQLDYPGAIDKGLPIGSGEIESAHRYVIQRRLKLPGAWWSAANASSMLALRLNRANGEWESYWAYGQRFAA
jgi:hypothetical protein